MWLIAVIPSISCCSQTLPFNAFDSGTTTAPQDVWVSLQTLKKTSIWPYAIVCSFLYEIVKIVSPGHSLVHLGVKHSISSLESCKVLYSRQ